MVVGCCSCQIKEWQLVVHKWLLGLKGGCCRRQRVLACKVCRARDEVVWQEVCVLIKDRGPLGLRWSLLRARESAASQPGLWTRLCGTCGV